MCRAADTFLYTNTYPPLLRITSFYVRFPGHRPYGMPFPDSLTLVYLPRISEADLEINGMKVRPDSPAFATLHRVVKGYGSRDGRDGGGGGVLYGCRDKVRAGTGLRFEIYLGEEKILKGTFRKEGEVECRCVMEREMTAVRDGDGDVAEVVVRVEGGGGGDKIIRETVRMVATRRRGKRNGFRSGLEEIPEESEVECGSETCDGDQCSCCGGLEDYCKAGEGWDDEVNTEGVQWVVDVGIWVFCLGVGFLVSRASSNKLRRRRLL